ncbi:MULTISPECIES: flagellar hook-length control protein FliK [unclassified Photobacterium]|uniref:flagellar hook-length control protein FliK n=1 Tax=unclassified Photobacterium TaxID=2628852 RepID=UPI001EE062D3|nr:MULTISPECIES: flagellar hook-length control protein FliK [unclassified Photobacterium]MCG3864009.1 flagellar hook-length control protein FliK [Photobacterium sp. Ph6]MCG3875463.1 flagellar hook-length control protein FliK [Photobacterium sp. Ph5]
MLINTALTKIDNVSSSSEIKQAGMLVESSDATVGQEGFSKTLKTFSQQSESTLPELLLGNANTTDLEQIDSATVSQHQTLLPVPPSEIETTVTTPIIGNFSLNHLATQSTTSTLSSASFTQQPDLKSALSSSHQMLDGVNTSAINHANNPIKEVIAPLTMTSLPSSALEQMSSLNAVKTPVFNGEMPAAQSVQNLTAVEQVLSAQAQTQTNITVNRVNWAPISVDPQSPQWGEKMLNILQDRVSLQATQNMQEARIRLDPPDLGKLDLIVKMDGDKLNVQISANNTAVRDALNQVSERLRHDLQQQFVSVDVNISQGKQHSHSDQTAQHSTQDDNDHRVITSSSSADVETSTTNEHWLSTLA